MGLNTQPWSELVLSIRVRAKHGSNSLQTVGQKVLDSVEGGLGMSYVSKFSNKSARDDGVKGSANVYEKHPHISLLVFKVDQWQLHPLYTYLL